MKVFILCLFYVYHWLVNMPILMIRVIISCLSYCWNHGWKIWWPRSLSAYEVHMWFLTFSVSSSAIRITHQWVGSGLRNSMLILFWDCMKSVKYVFGDIKKYTDSPSVLHIHRMEINWELIGFQNKVESTVTKIVNVTVICVW